MTCQRSNARNDEQILTISSWFWMRSLIRSMGAALVLATAWGRNCERRKATRWLRFAYSGHTTHEEVDWKRRSEHARHRARRRRGRTSELLRSLSLLNVGHFEEEVEEGRREVRRNQNFAAVKRTFGTHRINSNSAATRVPPPAPSPANSSAASSCQRP